MKEVVGKQKYRLYLQSKETLKPEFLSKVDEYEQECIKTGLQLQFYNKEGLQKLKDEIIFDIDRSILQKANMESQLH